MSRRSDCVSQDEVKLDFCDIYLSENSKFEKILS